MADATVTVKVAFDFSGMAASFRAAADGFDALAAQLAEPATPVQPDAPAAHSFEEPAGGYSASTDPEGP